MPTLRLMLCLALAGCGAADANTVPDRTPAAFDRMLGEWDAMQPGAARDALADKIDRAAGQRYATASRMYWHTDLAAAKAEAKKTNRPILSLRMLGRLDEDLSCANSRYFRIALYANAKLSKFLRDNFVLHWSSERAVPRITIDFGDGRKLERTITGNSAHYVLDAEGRPLDVLPGLYAPAVFEKELATSLELARSIRDKTGLDRDRALADHHRKHHHARYEQWQQIARVAVPTRGEGFRPEAFAQLATVTKSGVEFPTYRVVDLGVNVGKLPDDANAWAQLGLRLMPEVKDGAVPSGIGRGRTIAIRGSYVGQPGTQIELPRVTLPQVGEILDANSRALLAKLSPVTWTSRPTPAPADQLARLVDRFERDILADTAINEFDLRLRARSFFMEHHAQSFEQLNELVYKDVFKTPKTDAWLGLAPTGITALPADGLVTSPSPVAAK